MAQSAHKPRRDSNPETAESYLATQHPAGGKITIVRTPARKGFVNAIKFKNSAEMKLAMSLSHSASDIDCILEELAELGSVEFSVSR